MEVLHYLTRSGKNVVETWLDSLNDKHAEARIAARLDRISAGHFGDCKSVGSGVWELRIDFGPGYRIYYAMVSGSCVLLLCGGAKRRQSADIANAIEYWEDYRRRSEKS